MNPQGGHLLNLARRALNASVKGQEYPKSESSEERGVFVTLKKDGDLRGCIGFPEPVFPLKEAICKAAESAALKDPRFPPVKPHELDKITIELSILTLPQEMTCNPEERPQKVRVGTDGLIVENPRGRGLLLPQVPEEFGWDATEFLRHTCLKAGLPENAWKEPETRIFTFQAEVITESEN